MTRCSVAVEGLEFDGGAERGLGDRDRHLGDQVVIVSHEEIVRCNPEVDVQVARSPAAWPDRSPTGQAQRRAGVDAGGNVDLVRLVDGDPTLAPARAARVT